MKKETPKPRDKKFDPPPVERPPLTQLVTPTDAYLASLPPPKDDEEWLKLKPVGIMRRK